MITRAMPRPASRDPIKDQDALVPPDSPMYPIPAIARKPPPSSIDTAMSPATARLAPMPSTLASGRPVVLRASCSHARQEHRTGAAGQRARNRGPRERPTSWCRLPPPPEGRGCGSGGSVLAAPGGAGRTGESAGLVAVVRVRAPVLPGAGSGRWLVRPAGPDHSAGEDGSCSNAQAPARCAVSFVGQHQTAARGSRCRSACSPRRRCSARSTPRPEMLATPVRPS